VGSAGARSAAPPGPWPERGTRLLADTLAAIHEGLLSAAIARDDIDLSQVGPILDDLAAAITEVVVTGPVQEEQSIELTATASAETGASASVGEKGISAGLSSTDRAAAGGTTTRRVAASGERRHRVHFG